MASPAYYYKEKHIAGDRITYTYNCVLDGTVVETVKTRKQAQAWWERTMRDLKRMETTMVREVKGRRYALHICREEG
jgi:hypothetical protein